MLALIKLLLSHGADPNVRDRRGSTALHKAAIGQAIEIVDIWHCCSPISSGSISDFSKRPC